jgi:hypothetical protein
MDVIAINERGGPGVYLPCSWGPRSASGFAQQLQTPSQDAICEAVEKVDPEKYAARANKVSESTFHDWMKKGADGIEPYASFREEVDRSSAQAVANLTARALAGGNGSSQATWFLERRFRDKYGPQLLVGGVAAAAPIQIENDLKVARTIRSSPEAVKKIHEAVLIAIAVDAKRNPKPEGRDDCGSHCRCAWLATRGGLARSGPRSLAV